MIKIHKKSDVLIPTIKEENEKNSRLIITLLEYMRNPCVNAAKRVDDVVNNLFRDEKVTILVPNNFDETAWAKISSVKLEEPTWFERLVA